MANNTTASNRRAAHRAATPPPDRRTALGNGTVVVEPRVRALVGAWFVDTLVMWVVTVTIVVGSLSLSDDSAAAALYGIAAWVLGSFGYGFVTGCRRSLGQRLARTQTVKIADGTVPGYWRSGWVMFVRMALAPVLAIVTVLTFFDGGVDGTTWHLSIDPRATEALRLEAPVV